MSARFTEPTLENALLLWLESLGWGLKGGPEIASDGESPERADYREVVPAQRLRDALLPKLVRSKLRVKDGERFLKERGL